MGDDDHGAGRSETGTPWWGSTQAQQTRSPDDELAAIIGRAARLGVPAWRVMAALGYPLPRG